MTSTIPKPPEPHTQRVLDPLERSSEILFGLIMVLTFTSSLSVSEAGQEEETRAVLAAALSCNVAWGLVDAAMYLMSSFMTRARNLKIHRALRSPAGAGHALPLIRDALPALADALTPEEVESLRQRIVASEIPATPALVRRRDLAGALGVFLLVFLSTFPVVIPFMVISEPGLALRTSNAVAISMMFATGWSLGRYAGRSGWRTGLGTVAVGLALMVITIALGG